MTHFSTELASQPSVWRQAQALTDELRSKLPADGARVGILGCGTSLYVAQAVAIYRERQGAGETDAFPGSELPIDRPWDELIAISRSGTTTEIIDAVKAVPDHKPVLGIVGEHGSPLGELLTQELDLPFADERSVVQTRFATTVLTLLLGAYGWDVEASAQRAERYLTESLPDWAGDIQQFVFLGRGVGMALAHEAALKFREILAGWSEGYATMEYRHGPISAINERSLVWILDDQEPSIDDQIRATGARLIRGEGDPLAELVRIHRFAEGLVELRGINPDQPPHITRSVVLAGGPVTTLAPTGTAVLALDLGATKLAVGVGHADGEMTRVASAPTNAAQGAQAALARALELAKRLHDEELADGGSIDAVGVATMGYTHETRVELAPNVPGWNALHIPGAVAEAFPGLPVTIGNDVHLAAQAEMLWGSLQSVGEGIYLNLGSGIAAGIICNGQLLSGANGVAGEVGYSLLRGGPEERMAIDGATPFEDYFGGAGAARRLAASPDLPGSVAELLELDGSPGAEAFIDELWTGIAVLAANLCTALNPSVLALGGGYVRGDSGVLSKVSELVRRAVPYPPEVVRARFGGDASLRGAVASALTLCGATR